LVLNTLGIGNSVNLRTSEHQPAADEGCKKTGLATDIAIFNNTELGSRVSDLCLEGNVLPSKTAAE
jgi:hypothetical protein